MTRHTTTCTGCTAVGREQTRAETGPSTRRAGHTIAALHGELDIASAPALREDLIGMLRNSSRTLILDLGAVTFCDAAGLAVLVGVQRRATALGITMRLAGVRPQITKLLRITGLDHSLTADHGMHDVRGPGRAEVRLG